MSVRLSCIGRAVCLHFVSHFRLFPGCRKELEDTYTSMDSSVHGWPDGVSFILAADCINKLFTCQLYNSLFTVLFTVQIDFSIDTTLQGCNYESSWLLELKHLLTTPLVI